MDPQAADPLLARLPLQAAACAALMAGLPDRGAGTILSPITPGERGFYPHSSSTTNPARAKLLPCVSEARDILLW
ncbi:hypothetical protein AAFF_G00391150 [Aldrovandia affinis]|uniref:Uncharacterized protein n=1 Tax=Aldrovandia affinis TaxID=143900 RepID=A0AAD7SG07_9TELE|nr:hypothetical protein AAFF_G00391150 [Aldrovandia affinis]